MRYAHSTRTIRRAPRVAEEYQAARGYAYGYDGRDLEELNRLIAAVCRVPRAQLGKRIPAAEEPGEVFCTLCL